MRFLDAVFLGLSSGSIYALVALGLVVVYRGTGHLNFAQGEMATLSAFIAWVVTTWNAPLWVATVVAVVFGFTLAATAEVVVIRPLSRRSPLAVFVGLIGLFLGINAITNGRWGNPPPQQIGSLFPSAPSDFVRVFDTVWRYERIGIFAITMVVGLLLYLLFQHTKIGLAMRAVSSNPESSRLVGVPTALVLAGSWGLAGALGALAGVLQAGVNRQVTPLMMFIIFVYASAAAILGGLDSPVGAIVAGLGIGILENLAARYAPGWIGEEMKLGVAVAAIFVVLLVRPSGLFGTAKVERV